MAHDRVQAAKDAAELRAFAKAVFRTTKSAPQENGDTKAPVKNTKFAEMKKGGC